MASRATRASLSSPPRTGRMYSTQRCCARAASIARAWYRCPTGVAGADLANLVNEAALFAARANKRMVGMDEFERAKDKIMMGAERRSMVMSESEKKMTAYHEAGHAIVGMTVPEHDPVYKVTII